MPKPVVRGRNGDADAETEQAALEQEIAAQKEAARERERAAQEKEAQEMAREQEKAAQERSAAPAVLFVPTDGQKAAAAAEEKVRIKAAANHACAIGGVRYALVKGESQMVPLNVKRVLEGAGVLAPL
jgi:hypothetical protein